MRQLQRFLQVVFGTLSLAFVIFIALANFIGVGVPAPLPPPRPAAAIALESAKRFQLDPIGRYAIISERPLFSPTRRPLRTPVIANGANGRGPTDQFVLTGVVIIADRKLALLKVGNSGEADRVKEGETISGWQVDEIFPDRVRMSAGGKSAVIAIWDAKKALASRKKTISRKKTRTGAAKLPEAKASRTKSADRSVPRRNAGLQQPDQR